MNRTRSTATLLVLGLPLALAAGASRAAAARTRIDRGMNLFSTAQDVEIGAEAASEAEKKLELLRDPDLDGYVAVLGRDVARVSMAPDFPYRFAVVDSADINAFALPGGPIYVNRGVLEAAADESELAGVLAHEVAHVAARHGTNQLSKHVLVQLPMAMLMGSVLKDEGGWKSTLAKLGLDIGMSAIFLSYSRGAETQADVLGTQELYDAGYDPQGMARFFARLDAQRAGKPSRLEAFFASHPRPADREKRVEQEIAGLGGGRPGPAPRDRSLGFERMKQRLKRLGPAPGAGGGEGPGRSGRTPPDGRPPASGGGRRGTGPPRVPPPSDRYVRFRDPGGRFRTLVPSDWEAGSSGDGAVTLAPPEGHDDATGELTHGVILRAEPVAIERWRGGLDAALDRVVEALRRDQPYLREERGARDRVVVDGEAALRTVLSGRNPRGRGGEYEEVVTLALRPLAGADASGGRPRGALLVLAVAPRADQAEFEPAFDQVLRALALP